MEGPVRHKGCLNYPLCGESVARNALQPYGGSAAAAPQHPRQRLRQILRDQHDAEDVGALAVQSDRGAAASPGALILLQGPVFSPHRRLKVPAGPALQQGSRRSLP